MSLNSIETPAEGLGSFWKKITVARRRIEPAPRAAERRESPSPGRRPPPISMERAAAGQQKRRFEITAEALAASYAGDLQTGHYAFRILKDEFDNICDEAEIAHVSDRQFALWLKKLRGVKKYRAHKAKITMYQIKPQRLARAA